MSCLLYLQKRCRLNYRPKDERSDRSALPLRSSKNYFIYLTANHFISPPKKFVAYKKSTAEAMLKG
jgi:hypothetical protein